MSEQTKAQFEQHEKQFEKNQILKQFKKNQILMSVDVIREVIDIIEQNISDEEEKEAYEMKHGLSVFWDWVEGKAQDK